MVKKLCAELVFQMWIKGHGRGHGIKMYSTNGKVLSIGNTLAKSESP